MIHSLRLRLLGLSALWVAGALIAAALVLQYLFAVNIERTARIDMTASLNRLAAVIMPEINQPAIRTPLPDPLYSTPLSGQYWQITALDNGLVTRSRSLWDTVLESGDLPTGSEQFRHDELANGDHLLVLSRHIEVADGDRVRPYLVSIAQDHAPLDAAAQSFNGDVVVVLAILGTAFLLAAWLQIVLGLAPLKAVRHGLEAVRQGRSERLEGRYLTELGPLVDEVNLLLGAREASLDQARSRAADLAHGLKTPLAAMHGISQRLRDTNNAHEADLFDSLSVEMSERIDHQLRLASLRQRMRSHRETAALNTTILRTLSVLKKTAHGEHLHWIADLGPELAVDVHRQDLLELVGIILENAAKWARTRVEIRGRRDGEQALLLIEDDGPGIAEADLAGLGERGRRLDETKSGTGLGLAMAGEILSLNRGQIGFGRAAAGGLAVSLRLPLSAG